MLQPAGSFSGSTDVVVVLKPKHEAGPVYHNGVMEGEWEASTVEEPAAPNAHKLGVYYVLF
jgi:hypothetical protein